jgi:hypothetical protein
LLGEKDRSKYQNREKNRKTQGKLHSKEPL